MKTDALVGLLQRIRADYSAALEASELPIIDRERAERMQEEIRQRGIAQRIAEIDAAIARLRAQEES